MHRPGMSFGGTQEDHKTQTCNLRANLQVADLGTPHLYSGTPTARTPSHLRTLAWDLPIQNGGSLLLTGLYQHQLMAHFRWMACRSGASHRTRRAEDQLFRNRPMVHRQKSLSRLWPYHKRFTSGVSKRWPKSSGHGGIAINPAHLGEGIMDMQVTRRSACCSEIAHRLT